MNFSFYIFGTPDNHYSQYPNDYTITIFSSIQEGVKGSRLVIYREMDLIHYAYIECIGNNNYMGFCLIFNKAQIQKPRELIKLFHFIIEKKLIEAGSIIKYTTDGELTFKINSLNDCAIQYENIKKYVNDELENNASKYEIDTITSTFNGNMTFIEVDENASDDQIVAYANQFNKVVINDDNVVENGYIPQIITHLHKKNVKAKEEIKRLYDKNTSLEKTKKLYRLVLLLTLIIFGCTIGLLLLNNNLKTTKKKLENANNTITYNKDKISNLSINIDSLNISLDSCKKILINEIEIRKEAESKIDSISLFQPLIVTKSSYLFISNKFKFDYYGLRDDTINFVLRTIVDNRKIERNYKNIVIRKGGPYSKSINFSDTIHFIKNKWYSFELSINNNIIGGGRYQKY